MEPVTFLCGFQVSAGEARAKSFIYGFVGLFFLFVFYFGCAFLAFPQFWHVALAGRLFFFFLFFSVTLKAEC